MRKSNLLLLSLLLISFPAARAQVSVRILFGVNDTESVRWDGTIAAQGGKIASIEPWRFEGADAIVGTTWHFNTHPIRLFNAGTQISSRGVSNVVANGIIANLTAPDGGTALKVTTAQGDFAFRLDELAYGRPLPELNGRVLVDRIPASVQITNTPDEEDYPSAAAGKNGDVWLAYVQFRHNPEHNTLRAALETAPKDFAKWKSPTGGDQIFVRKYSGGAWGKPMAVTAPGGDLYRTAIAIDGQGRPWVFWSQNVRASSGRANFEIFARVIANDAPGATQQISNAPGSDIDPVAATDSNGKVWVAWQGWRNGVAAIFAASQTGDKLSAPAAVSQSSANEWNPAIAADAGGRISVAWDSYRNENYDIYVRTASNGNWGPETPVAASARYEAYPSIAYDGSGRLWVAYEEGGKGWGKDFGAYNTNGVAVYQGRVIRLRGFEADGRAVEAAGDLGAVLPGMANIHLDKGGVQKDSQALDPDPKNSQTREMDRSARNMQTARNTMPRLLVDGSGRIWLAFRSAHPIWWSALGTVWTEHLVSFDGKEWSKAIYLNHSDNLLDNRPALVSMRGGQLLVLGSSDNRRQFYLGENISSPLGIVASSKADPYNNDLYANEIDLGPAAQQAAVTEARPAEVAGPEVADKTDLGLVKQIRDYRSDSQLRIVRGEFHRHSEISMDGGGDG